MTRLLYKDRLIVVSAQFNESDLGADELKDTELLRKRSGLTCHQLPSSRLPGPDMKITGVERLVLTVHGNVHVTYASDEG